MRGFIYACLVLITGARAQGNSISQVSFLHEAGIRDSVVLRSLVESEIPTYSKVEVYRRGKQIYSYSKKHLEIEGVEKRLMTEFCYPHKPCVYIFKINDRPEHNKFLVLVSHPDSIVLLGVTENNSAEIFGDLDDDGIFEIGGRQRYGNSDIKVFGIKPYFPRERLLESKLNSILKKR